MDDDDYLSMGYQGIIEQAEQLQDKRHNLQAEFRKLEGGPETKTSMDDEGRGDDEDDEEGDLLDSFGVQDLSFQESHGLIVRLREDIKATEANIERLRSNEQIPASADARKATNKSDQPKTSSSLGKKSKRRSRHLRRQLQGRRRRRLGARRGPHARLLRGR